MGTCVAQALATKQPMENLRQGDTGAHCWLSGLHALAWCLHEKRTKIPGPKETWMQNYNGEMEKQSKQKLCPLKLQTNISSSKMGDGIL